VSLRRVSGRRVLRRSRVLFLTWLAARPTSASAPHRSFTVDELGQQSAESGTEHRTGATLDGHQPSHRRDLMVKKRLTHSAHGLSACASHEHVGDMNSMVYHLPKSAKCG